MEAASLFSFCTACAFFAGNFVCQKKCSCPSDGSSCEVDPTCLPDTMQCLNGLVLIKHQDGSTE
eukprot:scaffold59101_cov30-Tisochrysis_lutea.AAC.1